MKSRESEEMYLETILLLKKQKGNVRSLDVAEQLGYSRASVSRAVGLLKQKSYIIVAPDGMISFTQEGEKRAKAIYERHSLLTEFFIKIGADGQTAEQNACSIEHIITPDMVGVIKRYMDK